MMITSILQLSNSPTLGESYNPKVRVKVIETEVEDDDGKVFPLRIEYEYSEYWGLGPEISVWSFGYKTNGKPNIEERYLREWVKECIEESAGCHVTYY